MSYFPGRHPHQTRVQAHTPLQAKPAGPITRATLQGPGSAPSVVDAFIAAHSSAQYAQIACLERENAALRGQLARFGGALGLGASSPAAVLAQRAEAFAATGGAQLVSACGGWLAQGASRLQWGWCSAPMGVQRRGGSCLAGASTHKACCPRDFCSAAWPWLPRDQMYVLEMGSWQVCSCSAGVSSLADLKRAQAQAVWQLVLLQCMLCM